MSWFFSEALSEPTAWYEPTSWWGGVWPLFCETDRAVDCFTSGRFLWRSDAQKWPQRWRPTSCRATASTLGAADSLAPCRADRPIAILHAVLYYGGLLTVLLLKWAGRYPRLPGADATWNKASQPYAQP